MPNFILVGVVFIVFLVFFSNFKPPPIPLTRALLFIRPLNIGLTQTCIATAVPRPPPPPPPHGNLTKAPRGRRQDNAKEYLGTRRLSSGGWGWEVLSFFSPYRYVGSGPESTVHPKINIRNCKKHRRFCTLSSRKDPKMHRNDP